jgi:hypothetical protein
VTPNYDGGLVLHGLCAHSGAGDAGYRLVAAADPEEWVRYPTTTACFLADSGTLASMFGTIINRIPRTKPTPQNPDATRPEGPASSRIEKTAAGHCRSVITT